MNNDVCSFHPAHLIPPTKYDLVGNKVQHSGETTLDCDNKGVFTLVKNLACHPKTEYRDSRPPHQGESSKQGG